MNENEIYEMLKATDLTVAELNEKLKRLQELESENERLRTENKDYYDRLNNWQAYIDNHEKIWECYTNNSLKQFAERLKGKAIRRQEFIGELLIDNIEYVKVKDIDETLKEFINTDKGDDKK